MSSTDLTFKHVMNEPLPQTSSESYFTGNMLDLYWSWWVEPVVGLMLLFFFLTRVTFGSGCGGGGRKPAVIKSISLTKYESHVFK